MKQTFEIGLAMAGTVSAGAYTAGVLDFLLEALESWEAARARDAPNDPLYPKVPDHHVLLRAVAGSSGGAITAAILARSLATRIEPVRNVDTPPDPPIPNPRDHRIALKNPLFGSWVQSIDIAHLLGRKDLEADSLPVRSLLDSSVLRWIGHNVLRVQGVARSAADMPRYVPERLSVFLTTTNLRGVPYSFPLSGEVTDYRHGMTLHADYVHFSVAYRPPAKAPPDAVDLAVDQEHIVPAGGWERLVDTALASSAFPFGLEPRLLERSCTEYDERPWPAPAELSASATPHTTASGVAPAGSGFARISPDWPHGCKDALGQYIKHYRCWTVDGGVLNNHPFELVRRALAGGTDLRNPRSGEDAKRAVIMVDPFPFHLPTDIQDPEHTSLVEVAGRMFAGMKNQARAKVEDLELALAPAVYSRFIITPTYTDGQRTTEPAIYAASLGGFGAFLAEAFRRHDFQLGRRNCQQFLRRYFALPESSRLFDGWRDAAWSDDYARKDPDTGWPEQIDPRTGKIDPTFGQRHLQIIPLIGAAAEPVPLPTRRSIQDVDLDRVREGVRGRLAAVGPRLIREVPVWWLRWPLRALWWPARLRGARWIMQQIETELAGLH